MIAAQGSLDRLRNVRRDFGDELGEFPWLSEIPGRILGVAFSAAPIVDQKKWQSPVSAEPFMNGTSARKNGTR